MKEDLYSFSKNAWHVKFFKWIWNIDPTKEFKSMCPYFWSYIGTIIILPIVLISKLFLKRGQQFRDFLYNYRDNYVQNKVSKLEAKWSLITDPKQIYLLRQTSCYKRYMYDIDFKLRKRVQDLYWIGCEILEKEQKLKNKELNNIKKEQKQKLNDIKNNIFIQISFGIIALGLISFLLYFLSLGLSYIYSNTDWLVVLYVIIGMIALIITIAVLYLLLQYIILPFIKWLSCRKCYLCKIIPYFTYFLVPFVFLWKGIVLFTDIVYNIYKKNCPLITWKE